MNDPWALFALAVRELSLSWEAQNLIRDLFDATRRLGADPDAAMIEAVEYGRHGDLAAWQASCCPSCARARAVWAELDKMTSGRRAAFDALPRPEF